VTTTTAVTHRVEAHAVGKRLGGRDALDRVSFAFEGPGVLAVVGENGAGKSTLLKLFAGLLAPDRGRVTIDDLSPLSGPPSVRRALGYVPEAADPFPYLAAGDVIRLVASIKGAPAPAALVEELGVTRLLGQRMEALSLGERRRVCLVLALLGDPWLLLLDEPTNGLDAAGLATLVSLLERHVARGGTALIATHDADLAARTAARTLRLREGRVAV
jgi:ABC-type multidrug transport system ATPase subunit